MFFFICYHVIHASLFASSFHFMHQSFHPNIPINVFLQPSILPTPTHSPQEALPSFPCPSPLSPSLSFPLPSSSPSVNYLTPSPFESVNRDYPGLIREVRDDPPVTKSLQGRLRPLGTWRNWLNKPARPWIQLSVPSISSQRTWDETWRGK